MTYHPFLFNPVLIQPIPCGHYNNLDDAIDRAQRELAKAHAECWVKILNQNYDIIWDSRKNDNLA